jgi:oligopeptide/dipeptide ABC transporter ATP-binding protein
MSAPLVEVRNLTKHYGRGGTFFGRRQGVVRAVDGIDFDLVAGETLGMVGESGCGKSTTGRLLLRLTDPTSGSIHFDGEDLAQLSDGDLRRRRANFQIIFQDPFSSLNPRMTIEQIVGDPLRINGVGQPERAVRVRDLLDRVGLPAYLSGRYPHEFSGGQRQRIGIARALALSPKFIVCDEPLSALDVSIQAQIINLMDDLQRDLGLTYLFIAHDLSVVRHISTRVAVMYLGRIVEIGETESLFEAPQHPYTRALLSAIPVSHPRQSKARTVLSGDVPSPLNLPSGCRFRTRCPLAFDRCAVEDPALLPTGPGRQVACHLATPQHEAAQ